MEYRLLYYFMTYQNRVATREQLLQHVWGANVYIDERTVDVQVKRLRKVLAEHGIDSLIQTIRGVGYLLINKEE
jgi:two-component system phosphate regulon response regulator PhoB